MHRPRGTRRERVEPNLYKRTRDGRDVFEVGYRDSAGRQRWVTVEGGIMAARRVRNDLVGRKARGEQVRPNPRLRFDEAAAGWLEGQVTGLRPSTQKRYEGAYRAHLGPRWARRRLDAISADQLGIDLVLPDFSYLRERADRRRRQARARTPL